MKLVINVCFGGFSLNDRYMKLFKAKYDDGIKRDDPDLIALVQSGKKNISPIYSELKVVEIPDGSFYIINDYDGWETVYYSKSEIHTV